jgi:hypothetical protein
VYEYGHIDDDAWMLSLHAQSPEVGGRVGWPHDLFAPCRFGHGTSHIKGHDDTSRTRMESSSNFSKSEMYVIDGVSYHYQTVEDWGHPQLV